MISLRYRFLFVHVPKTGGLSLYQSLYPCDDRAALVDDPVMGKVLAMRAALPLGRGNVEQLARLSEHASASALKQAMGEKAFAQLFSFAVIRNPWAIEVSNYHYMLTATSHPRHSWVQGLGSFAAYVGSLQPGARQAPYVCDENGQVLVRRLLTFEALDHEFPQMCRDLGIPASPLPHINRSSHRPWTSYYTAELFAEVAEKRRADVALCGVNPDPAVYGI